MESLITVEDRRDLFDEIRDILCVKRKEAIPIVAADITNIVIDKFREIEQRGKSEGQETGI